MYLTDWNFDKVKYDELVNINHANLFIFPAKIVFFLAVVHESAIQIICKLHDSGFLRSEKFFKISPDIINTRERPKFIFDRLSFSSFCFFNFLRSLFSWRWRSREQKYLGTFLWEQFKYCSRGSESYCHRNHSNSWKWRISCWFLCSTFQRHLLFIVYFQG